MFGTMFCQYETPCGWCVRLNKECTEKIKCKPKKRMAIAEENEILSEEELQKLYDNEEER